MFFDYNSYFEVDGIKYKSGTRIQFNNDFYKRHLPNAAFTGYQYHTPEPSCFHYISEKDGNTVWHFNDSIIDDLVWERDVVEIVDPIYYVEKTAKERIREKKERGETWNYILPGTIMYILAMIFISVFKECVWGWIAATIVYMNYRYEQLSR